MANSSKVTNPIPNPKPVQRLKPLKLNKHSSLFCLLVQEVQGGCAFPAQMGFRDFEDTQQVRPGRVQLPGLCRVLRGGIGAVRRVACGKLYASRFSVWELRFCRVPGLKKPVTPEAPEAQSPFLHLKLGSPVAASATMP